MASPCQADSICRCRWQALLCTARLKLSACCVPRCAVYMPLVACLPACQVTAGGLVKFIEASPSLQQLDVLMPEAGPGGAAVNFETCFALAAQCPQLKVEWRAGGHGASTSCPDRVCLVGSVGVVIACAPVAQRRRQQSCRASSHCVSAESRVGPAACFQTSCQPACDVCISSPGAPA